MSYNKEFVMRGMKFNSVKNQILTGYSGEIGMIPKVENKLHINSMAEYKKLNTLRGGMMIRGITDQIREDVAIQRRCQRK